MEIPTVESLVKKIFGQFSELQVFGGLHQDTILY